MYKAGLKHGTVTILTDGGPLEITTFRTEGAYSDARHPDAVTFVRSLREDLARRDFTVNAMAYSPLRGLSDPCRTCTPTARASSASRDTSIPTNSTATGSASSTCRTA